ncbi:hypothetical protein [Lysobacter sp. GCM10012299]|uniref:hypothetical protein n=1 Tax=Lysobacter sp. GCM10012299 TaxID=3317333 RepID=UPI003619FE8C
MSRIFAFLARACEELELEIRRGPHVTLRSGRTVVSCAHIPMLGAQNGMLIFDSYESIAGCSKEFAQLGYGFAVLDEPAFDEAFDLGAYEEMFSDWGWNSLR